MELRFLRALRDEGSHKEDSQCRRIPTFLYIAWIYSRESEARTSWQAGETLGHCDLLDCTCPVSAMVPEMEKDCDKMIHEYSVRTKPLLRLLFRDTDRLSTRTLRLWQGDRVSHLGSELTPKRVSARWGLLVPYTCCSPPLHCLLPGN